MGERAERREEERQEDPVVVDLLKLEQHAERLFLHRFVEYVRRARKENGRFLQLRAGDELAILAAADGSAEALGAVAADEGP